MVISEKVHSQSVTSDSSQLDCYSRAFYLAGLLAEERPLDDSEIRQLKNRCLPTPHAQPGNLVHLYNGSVSHIAVITALNPILVSDRHRLGGESRDGLLLTDLLLEYGGLDIEMTFLKP